ncbi:MULTISPECIES: hypothetical protein [Chryseobacterium]|jgi:hypothetical protein|uniref:Uncharacterized protein n=2 Tax=Chryseobacterium TaxID=59732 RepID=A0A543EJS3_9FLAO|nr:MULTISPECIES: hypothetical protein [Chryseobacterium]MDR6458220.1 hypothetical protein [Chryseobacterium vietnamense]TQM21772.1 hypothetical protein FB551_1466 [Chryseobacterium aquifrigidense]HCM35408.1 hypothetical protein [Chryseobacterium sp.]
MKKSLLPVAIILLGNIMFGQVGINTVSPKSSLDITAKNPIGNSSNIDGILIPRVDRQRALSMALVEPSTLIYVNDISTGTVTGQASNINAVGFYHFDGSTSKWVKFNTDTNIYNANGTLTSNRVMSMANNSLVLRNGNEANLYVERSGTGNLQSGQNVANLYTSGYVGDTNKTLSGIRTYYRGDGINTNSSMTFSVNGNINNNLVLASNNNVGIGTDSPTQKLDVSGNGRFIGNNADIKVESTTATVPTLSLYRQNAGENLSANQIFGRVHFKGFVEGGEKDLAGIRATYQGNGNTTDSELKFSVNGVSNSQMVLNSSGDLGIGIASPKAKLDISGTDSGVRLPQLTTAQRDAIASDRAHAATIIYNKDIGKIQVNTGTDTNRKWETLDSVSETLNTSATFTSNASQTITYTSTNSGDRVRFQEQLYNSTPVGYISKVNNTDFVLKGGRTYKVDVNMGRLKTSDAKHTWCHIFDTQAGSGSYTSVSIIPQSYTAVNWNSSNTMSTFVTIPSGNTKTIYVKCAKQDSGNVIINDSVAPQISITIMD